MPKTYYDSELTGAQIESALEAIHGVVTPSNNGKVLYIDDGKIKAASASRWGHGAVLEPLSVTANGDYTPPSGTDGFDSVHVAVPGATLTTKSITQNGTYNASQDNADGYSSVTVNVSGGGSAVVQPLSVTQNGTYNPPSGVDGYAPVIVNVSDGSEYQTTNYIESSGTQYINTGYSLSLNSRIECVAKVPDDNMLHTLFGVRDSSTSSNQKGALIYAGAAGANKNKLYAQYASGQTDYAVMNQLYSKTALYILYDQYVIANDDVTSWIHGSAILSTNIPLSGQTHAVSNKPLSIFALNDNGTIKNHSAHKLYEFRIYESGVLAMRLLPDIDSNDVVCLKDTVSGNYFYNAGTGDFVYGTDA